MPALWPIASQRDAVAGAIAAQSPAPMASASLMTPMQAMMVAKDPEATPDARLSAVFKAGKLLDNGTITQILNGVIYDGVDVNDLSAASQYTIDTALANPAGKGFAQLYALAKQGGDPAITAKAASAVLKRAQDKGASRSRLAPRCQQKAHWHWRAHVAARAAL